MSTPTAPVLEERPESDAIAWGWLVPLLWVLRRPLLGLTATLLRLAAALVMPALVILGAMKLWQVAANRLEKPEDASDPYPGDDETLNERAAELVPQRTGPCLTTGRRGGAVTLSASGPLS